MQYILQTPLSKADLAPLQAGDTVLLSGVVYTARDAAHARMMELLDQGKPLPFPIEGAAIYYVGPTPERPGCAIGAAGPTTSGRMDAYTPRLLDLGLACMIGHLIADELAGEKDVPMAVGPSLTFASKFELQNKSWKTPGVLANAGCHVSIITDSSVIPQQYLPLCAGMAIKAGMDPFDALKAITLNPAEHIGVADRVGSLEVGKDADLVITAGSPFEVLTEVKAVFIDGARIEQA